LHGRSEIAEQRMLAHQIRGVRTVTSGQSAGY